MIQFIAGTIVGSLVGITAMCLCTAAGRADEQAGIR